MATDINPLDSVVTMLTNQYQVTLVDNITPTIAKIYEKPTDKEPRPNEDFIFVYSELTSHNPIGMGANDWSEIRETVKIDIRSRPSNSTQASKISDIHARKVLVEVKRVIYNNIVNPDANFDELTPVFDVIDLSNGMRGLFRYVLKINLVDYCRQMWT